MLNQTELPFTARAPAAERIAAGRLDLDHLGSQVREDAGAEGRGDIMADFQHLEADQRAGAGGQCSDVAGCVSGHEEILQNVRKNTQPLTFHKGSGRILASTEPALRRCPVSSPMSCIRKDARPPWGGAVRPRRPFFAPHARRATSGVQPPLTTAAGCVHTAPPGGDCPMPLTRRSLVAAALAAPVLRAARAASRSLTIAARGRPVSGRLHGCGDRAIPPPQPRPRDHLLSRRIRTKSSSAMRGHRLDPPIDVALLELTAAATATERTVAGAADPRSLPGLALPDTAFTKGVAGPAVMLDSLALAYSPQKVRPPPTTWRVLWDKNLRGKIILRPAPDSVRHRLHPRRQRGVSAATTIASRWRPASTPSATSRPASPPGIRSRTSTTPSSTATAPSAWPGTPRAR